MTYERKTVSKTYRLRPTIVEMLDEIVAVTEARSQAEAIEDLVSGVHESAKKYSEKVRGYMRGPAPLGDENSLKQMNQLFDLAHDLREALYQTPFDVRRLAVAYYGAPTDVEVDKAVFEFERQAWAIN